MEKQNNLLQLFLVICDKIKTKLLQNNTISQSTPVYRPTTSLKVINYMEGNYDALSVRHLSRLSLPHTNKHFLAFSIGNSPTRLKPSFFQPKPKAFPNPT